MSIRNKIKATLGALVLIAAGSNANAQLEFGNSYVIGDKVNIAISGERGREGTAVIGGGFHQRAPGTRCGFVADPFDTGWDPAGFNGDFFMPGTEENGWGIEINGINYSNNYNVYEVLTDAGRPITHTLEGDCLTAGWTGNVEGVTVIVEYHLILTDLFYTTEITLVNNTDTDLTDVYYYRNVDPDNNQPISGSYTTTNTIVSQPTGDCQKSLVSAEAFTPHDSYLGFGALGPDFRVSLHGFSNRSGSDIWNGTGGLDGTVGVVSTADEAISLAYKTDIAAGDTVNFTYAVVLSEDAVEGAFSSLYYIDYTSTGGSGGGVISQCNPTVDTVKSCAGNPVILTVDGPNAGDYEWTWSPGDGLSETTGPTTEAAPLVTTTYTVVGVPISDCLSSSISKTIVVEFSDGPDLIIVDPGPYCEDFDLTTLDFYDANDIEGTVSLFFSEIPDSSTQVEPLWPSDMMGPDDDVYLMIGDTANGCYDWAQVIIDFGGLGAAGNDTTITLCGTSGTFVDLHTLITPGANPLGSFDEETFSGQFNEDTGVLNVGGLAGTYVFTYTVDGIDPCPDDDATFTVVVNPQPNANFQYEVDGVSSADGLGSTCIINTVDFVDFSTIPAGSIDTWSWNFGDATTSALENPSHLYTAVGEYTITLTVTTDEGCTSTFTKDIVIYDEPIIDIIFNEPTCFGFTDGSVTAFTAGGSGTFTIEITDEDGTILNVGGSNTANTLGAGTYFINMEDASGCSASGSVTLLEPKELIPYYRVVNPLCYGDSGYVVVDSVQGEAINNAINYNWNPNPAGISGFDADSSYWMVAGTYTLTVNDSKGCSNTVDITITQPTELIATADFEPAYCRVFDYQNGNGVLIGSATGGTGAPTYTWTDVDDPASTSPNTTWGGRNPGYYILRATDAVGCISEVTVYLDSLNPIADFEITSPQFTANYKGTAAIDAHFENQSLYYDNPNSPSGEPTFFWNLDTVNAEWILTHDVNQEYDTTYGIKGVSYTVDVCLVAVNKNGCKDTTCKLIEVFEPIKLEGVNVFTPNGDGINDGFTFVNYAKSINTFNCTIVNRWGIVVGVIDNINGAWDGTDQNGTPCKDGVYFYTYEAESDDGTKISGQGTVTINGTEY